MNKEKFDEVMFIFHDMHKSSTKVGVSLMLFFMISQMSLCKDIKDVAGTCHLVTNLYLAYKYKYTYEQFLLEYGKNINSLNN